MTKNARKLQESIAYALGTEAYLNGQACVPALDSKLTNLLTGNQVGESIPALKSWVRGFTSAMLNAVIIIEED